MAIETARPAEDLADGLYQVVSALGEGENNLRQLDVAARAAVAGVSDTKSAITLLAGAANAYNQTGEEALKTTSDLAFKAVELGVTTFPQLAASMGSVTPLAASFNTSQEELFATIATGTKVGTETAQVVTQLESIYSAFLKPTKELTKIAEDHEFKSAKAMLANKGLRQTLIILDKAVDGNSEKMAKLLRRKEANILATLLLGGQAENYKNILDEMQDASGATDEAFKKQTEGINEQGHSWEKTKRKMEVFAQRLGDKVLPALNRLLDRLEPIFESLDKISDKQFDWYIKLGLFLAALGPGLTILGKLISALGAIKAGLVTIAAITGTTAAVVLGAFAAIGAAIFVVYRHWNTLQNNFEAGIHKVVAGFWTAVRGVANAINWLIQKASSLPVIGSWFEGVGIDTSGLDQRVETAMGFYKERLAGREEAAARDYERMPWGERTDYMANKANQMAYRGTAANINKYSEEGGPGVSDEWQTQTVADFGKLQSTDNSSINFGDTNVTVNGAGGSPEQNARAIGRELRRRDKERSREIRNAKRALAGAEL